MTQAQEKLLPSSTNWSPNQLAELRGIQVPRLMTPPLVTGPPGGCICGCALTPKTSYGFKVIKFANEVVQQPLYPWQELLAIHIGELDPYGDPRLREVFIQIARQNGKTHFVRMLTLYWMFVVKVPLIIGTSSNLSTAYDTFEKTVALAKQSPVLNPLIKRVARVPGHFQFQTEFSSYDILSGTSNALLGLTSNRIILDELRMHKNRIQWDAAVPTMTTDPTGQVIAMSNAGWDDSSVLNEMRDAGVQYIKNGSGSDSLGLFEWSPPEGNDYKEPKVWCWANPSLNMNRKSVSTKVLHNEAVKASNGDIESEKSFRRERLSERVGALDSAINAAKWADCFDEDFTLKDSNGKPMRPDTFALDLNMSEVKPRATLMGVKILPDGRARCWIEKEWRDANAMAYLDQDIKSLLKEHKPRVFTWLPFGPAAAKSPTLKMLKVPGVQIQEMTGSTAIDACMALADEVRDLRISHPDDPLLNTQIKGVSKKLIDDRWRFTRKNGDSDAAFALAVAVHTARQLPQIGPGRLVGPDDEDGEE